MNFLKNNIGDCNATICREFIAYLIQTNVKYENIAFVRGKHVPLISQNLNRFLQIPLLFEFTMPYPNLKTMPLAISLLELITEKPNQRDSLGKIEVQTLLPPFYKLWMIISNCITPTSHKQDLYMPDILLIYNLTQDNPIYLVWYLISIVIQPSTKTYNIKAIKMGVLLTKLCENYDLQVRASDKIIKQLGIVDNLTFRQSFQQLGG